MRATWGIILAAGESRRMKEAKLRLAFNDATILECSIDNVLHSEVDHVMVVLGGNEPEYRSLIGKRPVSICINHEFRKGMLSSVQTGIRAIPADASAALIYLADQPRIFPHITNTVLEKKTDWPGCTFLHREKRSSPLN
jgi:molybdenum cofactor cytidylyltransferase